MVDRRPGDLGTVVANPGKAGEAFAIRRIRQVSYTVGFYVKSQATTYKLGSRGCKGGFAEFKGLKALKALKALNFE